MYPAYSGFSLSMSCSQINSSWHRITDIWCCEKDGNAVWNSLGIIYRSIVFSGQVTQKEVKNYYSRSSGELTNTSVIICNNCELNCFEIGYINFYFQTEGIRMSIKWGTRGTRCFHTHYNTKFVQHGQGWLLYPWGVGHKKILRTTIKT